MSRRAARPCLLLYLLLLTSLTAGCYAERTGDLLRVEHSPDWTAPPVAVAAAFSGHPDGLMALEAHSPANDYAFDPSEKDPAFGHDPAVLQFTRVEMRLHDRMPPGKVLADLAFADPAGNRIEVGPVDLLRLTPRLDTEGEMQYPELLLEEYERFGVSFRREHGEFDVRVAPEAGEIPRDAADRAYRLGVWNNCLDPTKWEMVLTGEDYSDFRERVESDRFLNQERMISHNWFRLPPDLYAALLRAKNPRLVVDPGLGYEELSNRAEQVVVDLSQLARVREPEPVRVLEIGHRSRRRLDPLVAEQHYKWQYGLVLNREQLATYGDVLDQPVRLASFTGEGFYRPDEPKEFDFSWLRHLDEVRVETLDVPGSDCYVQITLTGGRSPYQVVLGNIDMALLDEQTLAGLPFGINPYQKTRRHDPAQDTIGYEVDRMPENIRPYLFLIDRETGRWVNNQKRGLEKVFLGWNSIDRDEFEIYLVTYERMLPVWMTRVRLADDLTNRIRVRRALYTY